MTRAVWVNVWYLLVYLISVGLAGYMVWTGKMLSPGRLGGLIFGVLILATRRDRRVEP